MRINDKTWFSASGVYVLYFIMRVDVKEDFVSKCIPIV